MVAFSTTNDVGLDYMIWLWHYDSSGAIQTAGFNVFAHIVDYVLLLMIFQRFGLSQWGFPKEANSPARLDRVCCRPPSDGQATAHTGPASRTRSQTNAPARDFKVIGQTREDVPKEMTVCPDAEVYRSPVPALGGRRTAVWEAKDPSDSETLYCAKRSFPQTARPNEAYTVWTARDIVKDDDDALLSLPVVVAYRDYPELSTNNIRRRLRSYDDDSKTLLDDDPPAERIMRYIFEKKLMLWSYVRDHDLARAMAQCMRCECLSAALRCVNPCLKAIISYGKAMANNPFNTLTSASQTWVLIPKHYKACYAILTSPVSYQTQKAPLFSKIARVPFRTWP
jgi:hypothetical protein